MRDIRRNGKIVISYTRMVYAYCPLRLEKYIKEEPYITSTPEIDYGIEEHKNIDNAITLQELTKYPALNKFLEGKKYASEKEYYYEDKELNIVIHIQPDILAYDGKITIIDSKTTYKIDNDKFKSQLYLYGYAIMNLFKKETEARIYYTKYDYLTKPIITIKVGDKLPDDMVENITKTEIVLRNIENNKEINPIAGIWCKQCSYILQCPLASKEEKDISSISDNLLVGRILLLKRLLNEFEDELTKRLEVKGEINEQTPLGILKARYAVRNKNIQDMEKIYNTIKDREDFLSYINSFNVVKIRKLINNNILPPDVIKTEKQTTKEIEIKLNNEKDKEEEEQQ